MSRWPGDGGAAISSHHGSEVATAHDYRRSTLSRDGECRNQMCLSMALASPANKVAVVSSQNAAALSRACLAECRNLARARSMAEM